MKPTNHTQRLSRLLVALLGASLVLVLGFSPDEAPLGGPGIAEAQFPCICPLGIVVMPYGDGGTTDPPPGHYEYPCGEWVTITAIPWDGWEFLYWGSACSGTYNPLEYQCNGGIWRNCFAYFGQAANKPPDVEAGDNQTAYVGDTVYFSGSAEDPDGTIESIEWDFGDGESASGTLSPTHEYEEPGEYTVTLTACDDDGACSDDSLTVEVLDQNLPPVVHILEPNPGQEFYVGDTVYFSGSAEDPDGGIDLDSIHWDFGDGGSDSGSVSTSHNYSGPDEYTVTLTVCDDDGACSGDALEVTVLSAAGQADLAVLKWAPVEPVVRGDRIEYGISVVNLGPDDAHGITVTDELPPGLTYESDNCGGSVTDLDWFWEPGALASGGSAECELTVIVNDDAPETLTNTAAVFSATPDPDPDNNWASATVQVRPGSLSLEWRYPKTAWMGRNYGISLWVENPGPSEQELSVRLQEVPVSDETTIWFGDSPYFGSLRYFGGWLMFTVPPGWQGELASFTVNSTWEWIRAPDILNFADLLKQFALAVPLPVVSKTSNLLTLLEAAEAVANAYPERTYAFRGEAQSPSDTFDPIHMRVDLEVPRAKRLGLILSLAVGIAGGQSTTAGFVSIATTLGAGAAPELFFLEVGGFVSAKFIYLLAADPAPDFTELAEAQPIPLPDYCLPDGETIWSIADDYSILLGVLQALSDSYIRWEAAEDAESAEWMALHLDRIERYANEAADIIDGLIPVTEGLLSGIPVPTESQIFDIRQSMADTGLPGLEVCLLEGLGYAPEEIDAIRQAFLAFPDEYFVNFGELPDMMAVLAAALRDLSDSVAKVLPVGALTLGLSAGWNHACYIGSTQPIELALASIIENVLAVYRLTPDQTFDRWFPGRPEVSTITGADPYDALLILMAGDTTWAQEDAEAPPESVNLTEGWNSICYTGQTKSADDAISGMAGGFDILYRLSEQVWGRFIPDRPEVSNIAQLVQYDAVLTLVTEPGGTIWTFDP